MSDEPLEQPQVFGGYLLLSALGRGAMGDVFLARPLEPDRGVPSPVVVKRLHGDLASKPGFVARFRHEAAVAVCVDSPHVARVFDVGAVGDTLYIALEYVPGWPLSKVLDAVLKSGRHASVASVVDLIAGGLEGLHALHTAIDVKTGRPLEIVHRDLSPKNLMVGEDGRMRLIDLGLGKSNAQDWRTRTGVVMGSVGYMPPEQARGERVDARADVYAMGVVAFEMLALRNYIKRGTISEMMEASATPTFVRPSEFRPDVPRELDQVIDKALRADRDARFSSAKAFLDALRGVVPPAFTEGGMASLLAELFGDTKQIREQQLAELLARRAPDDFETRPTKVFVVRDGIVPVEEVRTETVPTVGGPGERTALTEVSARSGSVRVRPASQRSQDPLRQPAGMPSSRIPVTTHHHTQIQRGISLPVLIVAVVAAAVLGGLVAVFAVLAVIEREAPAPAELVSPAPSPTEAPTVTERPTPAPPPPAARVEPPPAPPRPRPTRRAPKAPTRVAEVTPPPPAAPPSNGAKVDAALARLEARARVARSDAQTSAAKAAANKVLIDIAVWKRSGDLARKRAAVRELEARLNEL